MELGVGAGADEDQVGEVASELVREAEKHGRESCPIYPTIRGQDRLAQPCWFTCRRLTWRQFELTLGGLPPHVVQPMSQLALGTRGGLMAIGFCATGLGILLLALLIRRKADLKWLDVCAEESRRRK